MFCSLLVDILRLEIPQAIKISKCYFRYLLAFFDFEISEVFNVLIENLFLELRRQKPIDELLFIAHNTSHIFLDSRNLQIGTCLSTTANER